MSNASEWVKILDDFIENRRPTLRDENDEPLAFVTEYGELRLEKRGYEWNSEDARKLARWILATFGDEPTP